MLKRDIFSKKEESLSTAGNATLGMSTKAGTGLAELAVGERVGGWCGSGAGGEPAGDGDGNGRCWLLGILPARGTLSHRYTYCYLSSLGC